MPDVVKHAWTHRPRAQGGTDPIEVEASATPSAVMLDGFTSRTTGSKLYMTFGLFYRNAAASGVFGYSNVTGSKAKFLTISENGIYVAWGNMGWNSDFTAGDQPRIVFSTNQLGADGDLVPGLDVTYNEEQSGIWNEQISADDMDHHTLRTMAMFNVDLSLWGETPMKIGLALYSNNSRTKSFFGQMGIYRVTTDLMAQVTIT